ncbi:hypothetical protein [Phenylobacterium sp.]|uniref:hypothetical protein n=1 Tax=Phenylobacterium sp. TaxID=1871053 RepID=UPI003BA8954F
MTKYFAGETAVERIGAGLLDRSLPKSEWTHAAHFAAALWLLRRHGEAETAQRMPGLIRAYNEAVGGVNSDTEGYHETITQASIGEAARFLATRPPAEPLHVVVDQLMASPLGDRDWPLAYWSKDRLFSVAARRGWVAPDVAPLPQA